METRFRLRMEATVCFVIGLLIVLSQTRSSGTALEEIKFSLEAGAFFIVGLAVVGISAALFAASFYFGRKAGKL